MWKKTFLSKISNNKTYSRDGLFQLCSATKADLTDSMFRWTLYGCLQQQQLFRVDYDTYTTRRPAVLPKYKPVYSDKTQHILSALSEQYPELSFVVFESTLLNEFLNHQIAQNTIYVQVDKEISSYIFEILHTRYSGNVLYKPSQQEFDRYWTNNCLVVLDLISQSPLSSSEPHEMTAEKMLVDIVSEKSIAATFSPAELPSVFDNVLSGYKIETRRMKRYAGRRGKLAQIRKYMEMK